MAYKVAYDLIMNNGKRVQHRTNRFETQEEAVAFITDMKENSLKSEKATNFVMRKVKNMHPRYTLQERFTAWE